MDEKITFDLAGLCGWAAEQAIKQAEQRTGIGSLGELLTPMAKQAIQNAGIASALEIDPMIMLAGRVVLAGMDAQKKRTESRRMADATRNG